VKAFGPELVRSIKRSFVFTIFHRIFVAHDAQLRRKRNSQPARETTQASQADS